MEENKEQETVQAYAFIMAELLQSEKFQEFFEMNYEVGKFPVEGEEGKFEYRVRELPEAEVYQRMQSAIAKKVQKVGGKKIKTADASMLDKLNQINPSLVKK